MKIQLEIELTEREAKILCSHSLERVINSSVTVAHSSRNQDAGTVIDDWLLLKPLAVRLWGAAHNSIFAAFNPGQAIQVPGLEVPGLEVPKAPRPAVPRRLGRIAVRVYLQSDAYGREEFEYSTDAEAIAGICRLIAKCRKQTDGIDREVIIPIDAAPVSAGRINTNTGLSEAYGSLSD
jgi:hypothetical protein